MSEFRHIETPPYGTCVTCGTSQHPDGFVDAISQVTVSRGDNTITGVVDVIMCAPCVEQMAKQIGCFSKKESERMDTEYRRIQDSYEKASDEAYSWQQRYENIVEIMSLVQLKSDNSNGVELSSVGGPTPDLRVAEGEPEHSQSDGAVAKRRKNARG